MQFVSALGLLWPAEQQIDHRYERRWLSCHGVDTRPAA